MNQLGRKELGWVRERIIRQVLNLYYGGEARSQGGSGFVVSWGNFCNFVYFGERIGRGNEKPKKMRRKRIEGQIPCGRKSGNP